MAAAEHLKLPQVLAELGISRSAFYRLRALGRGPRLIKLPNGQIRIRRADLEQWLTNCEEEQPC
jgi:predicted DNA-binding transcriptional regulator AlpA